MTRSVKGQRGRSEREDVGRIVPAWVWLLHGLRDGKQHRLTVIARRYGLSHHTLHKAVRRLEAEGLVRPYIHNMDAWARGDRRRAAVVGFEITDEGLKALNRARSNMQGQLDALEEG